ncbi:peptidoglycan/LPS O-acetylase OafA/YrhL [Serinibacter salmoneus]|uniref:Peptidoglycan/LPS O-acetylase OafA/YrhL n=2 Tax=Serinibacter salmoneus TaxID=556530 RepID=A0A2A9CZP7_9MICO|nr:peptidoglycan/LPS O-acetylase OafA/YrhL [Serinibacter salmoneus]
MRSSAHASPPKKALRRDIQGIRALAVVVVFLDHLLGWPHGGFAGVDMFFVISGFLITGLLLREYEGTGHISFLRFYGNRIKRIVPAATVVLLVTVALGYLIFPASRAQSVTWDAVWSFLFGQNWNLALEGTDYFGQGAAVSPLQHYWSLSVEEQFYFVWPWLLLGLLLLYARFRPVTARSTRLLAGGSIGIVSVSSFVWAMIESTASPTFAYFSTLTRGWELGIGAAIAVAAPAIGRSLAGRAGARTLLSWAGLAIMVVSVFVITPESVWPAPWALLPVLGAAMAIAAGIGDEPQHAVILTNPVSKYIGDISYSLYLWHFPAIVFGMTLFPGSGSLGYALTLVVGFALAVASYHAIEKPIHQSPLFKKPRAREAWKSWRSQYADSMKYGATGFLAVTTAVLAFVAITVTAPTTAPVVAATTAAPIDGSEGTEKEQPSVGPAQLEVTQALEDALGTSAWPEAVVEQIGTGSGMSEEFSECADPATAPDGGCTWGDGERTAVLLGDSTAAAYAPILVDILTDQGWTVRSLAMNGCEFSTLDLTSGGAAERCADWKEEADQLVQETQPDAVIITTQFSISTITGTTGNLPVEDWTTGFTEAVQAVVGSTEKVVLLTPAPYEKQVSECYSTLSAPADCVSTPTQGYLDRASVVRDLAGADPTIEAIESQDWFCVDGLCPAFAQDELTKADTVHPYQPYLTAIRPAIEDALLGALELGAA